MCEETSASVCEGTCVSVGGYMRERVHFCVKLCVKVCVCEREIESISEWGCVVKA